MQSKKLTTDSDITVEEVYTATDIKNTDDSLPGEFPFTSGVQASMYRGKLWTMRQYAGFSTAEEVTELAIRALVARESPLVAILWGKDAASLQPLLGSTPTVVSVHPSPLSASRGFFGSRPFSRANAMLAELGADPVDCEENPQKYDIPDSVIGFMAGELGDLPGGWP